LHYKIFHKEKTKKKHFLAQLGVFLMTVQEIVYFLKCIFVAWISHVMDGSNKITKKERKISE
jgi:hypothetical protein